MIQVARFRVGNRVRWSKVPGRPFVVSQVREFTNVGSGETFCSYDLWSTRSCEANVLGVIEHDLSPWHGEDWDSEAI